jgi:hypothetical protein
VYSDKGNTVTYIFSSLLADEVTEKIHKEIGICPKTLGSPLLYEPVEAP